MKQSSGFLVYRETNGQVEVLLVHPAGPFWGKKDLWTIPKGELDAGEDRLGAARREFEEETSLKLSLGKTIDLGEAKQGSSKINYIWAIENNIDLTGFNCTSMVRMEWPPKSGQIVEFPEVDRAQWFDLTTAKQKLFKTQAVFIDRLAERLNVELPVTPEQQSLI